jgi:lipopolysaccharide transport system ATP-binding protein
MSSIIRAEALSKKYVIGHQHGSAYGTLRDEIAQGARALARKITHPFTNPRAAGAGTDYEEFWALRDVSFEVKEGERLGIIGRNGAGKSTLLKILSRITEPTSGRVTIGGRVASLLEVGTGFHPELSGRENIYLNGAILGMSRVEIARKFDEIVTFAEIAKFLDTPVKRYSSGMYVRLAFAVAANLETDVLLVDEVLAVGDAAFQRKSLGKMSEVAKGGRTVLFVSHNLSAIRNLCSRVLLLQGGNVSFNGMVDEGLAIYERSFSSAGRLAADAFFVGPLAEQIQFHQLICRQSGETVTVLDPLREFEIELHGSSGRSFPTLELKVSLFREGVHVASCHDTPQETALREGTFVSRFAMPADVFRSGRYTIGIGASASIGSWTWGSDVGALDFSENLGGRSADRSGGVVAIPYMAQRVQ